MLFTRNLPKHNNWWKIIPLSNNRSSISYWTSASYRLHLCVCVNSFDRDQCFNTLSNGLIRQLYRKQFKTVHICSHIAHVSSPFYRHSSTVQIVFFLWPGLFRRPYNLYCVGADVKPCSINLFIRARMRSTAGYLYGISVVVHVSDHFVYGKL